MSGSWKEAMKASAAAERPSSQAMYLVRTSPMRLEAIVADISSSVAVKAVWRCEGVSTAKARRQRGVIEEEAIRIQGGSVERFRLILQAAAPGFVYAGLRPSC